MTGRSVPRTRGKHEDGDARPSTRELLADAAFCELLAEDLGVKVSTARTAFIGEPKVRCIRVVEWALRHQPDDPAQRARMCLAWARKRGAGAFRSDDGDDQDESLSGILDREGERFERLAEALARMWVENPESLAEAIRALEQSRNGRS